MDETNFFFYLYLDNISMRKSNSEGRFRGQDSNFKLFEILYFPFIYIFYCFLTRLMSSRNTVLEYTFFLLPSVSMLLWLNNLTNKSWSKTCSFKSLSKWMKLEIYFDRFRHSKHTFLYCFTQCTKVNICHLWTQQLYFISFCFGEKDNKLVVPFVVLIS